MVKLFSKNFPTYVITIHQRYRQTDGQTTCDRNTALCTKVHRAVKRTEAPGLIQGNTKGGQSTCTWMHMEPPFLGKGTRGGRRGSAMAPFERAMVVSYRLPIVTVALSIFITIRPQFAIECPTLKSTVWVTLGQNFGVFPLK